MDEMATLMSPWGWSRNIARVFAYLLISEQPVTLDRIAADLGMSKSIVSVSARELADYGNALRISQPGTKQLLYAAPDDRFGPFSRQSALLGTLAQLLKRQEAGRDAGKVRDRLGNLAEFSREMRQAIAGVIARFEAGPPDQPEG